LPTTPEGVSLSKRVGSIWLVGLNLELSGVGMPAFPTCARIYRDAFGKWWESFVTKTCKETLLKTNGAAGVEWGVTETAINTDEAFDLPHPLYAKTTAAKLARLYDGQAEETQ